MFCTKCGSEIPEEVVFCTNCGARQDMEADSGAVEKASGKGIKELAAACRVRLFSKGGNKKPAGKATLVIGAAVIAIGAGALFFLNIPKNKVMLGAYRTGKAISREATAMDQILGVSDIKDDILNGRTMQTVSAEIKGSDFAGGLFPDVGLKGEIASDRKKGTLLITGFPTYNGKEQCKGIVYRSEAQTVLAVPDLYDGYFYFDNATAKDDFYRSALNRFLLEQGIKLLQDAGGSEESVSYSLYTRDAWKQLYQGAKVTRDDRKSFLINGKLKKCRGYKILFSKKDMKDLLKNHIKFIEKSSAVRTLAGFSAGEMQDKAETDRIISSMSEELEDLLDMLNDDLTMLVYIGPKGRVVSAEWEYEFEGENFNTSVEMALSLLGKGNPLDDVALEFDCGTPGDGDFSLEFTGSQTLKKSEKQVDSAMELNVSTEYGKEKCTWDGSVNAKNKTWDLTVKLPSVIAKADGTLDNIRKGKSLQVDIDKLKLEVYGTPFLFLKGSYSVAPLGKTKIEDPSKGNETIELFDMGENELKRVLTSVVQNMTKDMDALLKPLI